MPFCKKTYKNTITDTSTVEKSRFEILFKKLCEESVVRGLCVRLRLEIDYARELRSRLHAVANSYELHAT